MVVDEGFTLDIRQRRMYNIHRPRKVCVRSRRVVAKSRDLDALGSREVMVVMKAEIVVMVE